MDPTAYDRWWKRRIEREEMGLAMNADASKSGVRLNTIGAPQIFGTHKKRNESRKPRASSRNSWAGSREQVLGHNALAKSSTMCSAGANTTGSSLANGASSDRIHRKFENQLQSTAMSVASFGSQKVSDKKSNSSQAAASVASYPATPRFSEFSEQTGEILEKLDKLERDIMEEKAKRTLAEQQIQDLITRRNTPKGTPRMEL